MSMFRVLEILEVFRYFGFLMYFLLVHGSMFSLTCPEPLVPPRTSNAIISEVGQMAGFQHEVTDLEGGAAAGQQEVRAECQETDLFFTPLTSAINYIKLMCR